MKIVDAIKKLDKFYHAKACAFKDIRVAQEKLDLVFSDEFMDYVRNYGAISLYATEWTGLNVPDRINVVTTTLKERELDAKFPKNCYVIENLAIEGIVILSDESDTIYEYANGRKKVIASSLSEYLDICKKRKK